MMSRAKFEARLNGMTAVAKKAYAAVPINESWPASKIAAELQRISSAIDFHILQGCLNSLIDTGLVRETSPGQFRREPVKNTIPLPLKEDPMSTPNPMSTPKVNKPTLVAAPPAAASSKTPIDRLGELADQIATLARQLQMLAAEVADAAIDAQEQVETNAEDLAKLKQLQTLLKSLGNVAA